MKSIITEEMRYREKVVEYAINNHNNAQADRRYGTSHREDSNMRNIYLHRRNT